jgi:hypothetical protein
MIENGRTRTISEILAITDHDIEAVGSFKNLRNVNDNNNDETEEIKTRITAANTAYSPLHITFRSKQIHRNNKIRLYKTLKKPVLCYGSVNWTVTQMTHSEILRRIYGPIQDKGRLHLRWNSETHNIYKYLSITNDKIRRTEWAVYKMISKKGS